MSAFIPVPVSRGRTTSSYATHAVTTADLLSREEEQFEENMRQRDYHFEKYNKLVELTTAQALNIEKLKVKAFREQKSSTAMNEIGGDLDDEDFVPTMEALPVLVRRLREKKSLLPSMSMMQFVEFVASLVEPGIEGEFHQLQF
jgi:hypothetical protein